jgi:large subunit ribosomal protein L22
MEVIASNKLIKSSVQKVGYVADLIRNENVANALLQLQFSKKGVSGDIGKVLKSAIANSQNNYGLDIDKLFVKEVRVGKSITLKRSMVRAKGRINRIIKPFTKVTIVLEERG